MEWWAIAYLAAGALYVGFVCGINEEEESQLHLAFVPIAISFWLIFLLFDIGEWIGKRLRQPKS